MSRLRSTEDDEMSEPAPAAPVPGAVAPAPNRFSPRFAIGFAALCGLLFFIALNVGGSNQAADDKKDEKKDEKVEAKDDPPEPKKKVAAPDLDGGVAWLNTGGPLAMKDLKGKVVLLDFW